MTSHVRPPTDLTMAIIAHKEKHGKDPELVMLQITYKELYNFYFKSRLHTLCCGKGMLFDGIPTILTPSPMVETFLICY